jgi:hypothetical protein
LHPYIFPAISIFSHNVMEFIRIFFAAIHFPAISSFSYNVIKFIRQHFTPSAQLQAHFIWVENQTTLTWSLAQNIAWRKHPEKTKNNQGKNVLTCDYSPVNGEWSNIMEDLIYVTGTKIMYLRAAHDFTIPTSNNWLLRVLKRSKMTILIPKYVLQRCRCAHLHICKFPNKLSKHNSQNWLIDRSFL